MSGRTEQRLAAYAACGWSVAFLVPHIYWAAGGTAGLPNAEPLDGTIAAVNGAAIVLSVLAALLALALTRRSRMPPRRVLMAAAWSACVALALRGLAGLGEGVLSGGEWSEEGSDGLVIAFETLFLVGGVLFGLAAREATTADRGEDRTARPSPEHVGVRLGALPERPRRSSRDVAHRQQDLRSSSVPST